MAYFIDLFSPETYEAFARSPRDISGFRLRHKNMAERIKGGDVFVCYLTRLSRWFGLLEVIEGPFINDKPIFVPKNDPFVVRFRVRTAVWLDIEKSIPIVQFFFNETKSNQQVSHFWLSDSRFENPVVGVEKRLPYLPQD